MQIYILVSYSVNPKKWQKIYENIGTLFFFLNCFQWFINVFQSTLCLFALLVYYFLSFFCPVLKGPFRPCYFSFLDGDFIFGNCNLSLKDGIYTMFSTKLWLKYIDKSLRSLPNVHNHVSFAWTCPPSKGIFFINEGNEGFHQYSHFQSWS